MDERITLPKNIKTLTINLYIYNIQFIYSKNKSF